jgi:hypothetical protein
VLVAPRRLTQTPHRLGARFARAHSCGESLHYSAGLGTCRVARHFSRLADSGIGDTTDLEPEL